jgi:hypothetical protein
MTTTPRNGARPPACSGQCAWGRGALGNPAWCADRCPCRQERRRSRNVRSTLAHHALTNGSQLDVGMRNPPVEVDAPLCRKYQQLSDDSGQVTDCCDRFQSHVISVHCLHRPSTDGMLIRSVVSLIAPHGCLAQPEGREISYRVYWRSCIWPRLDNHRFPGCDAAPGCIGCLAESG